MSAQHYVIKMYSVSFYDFSFIWIYFFKKYPKVACLFVLICNADETSVIH